MRKRHPRWRHKYLMRVLTAAIVAELFLATKIVRQALVGNTFSAQAPAVIDQGFPGSVIR
jgi:hypothetical protein